MAAPPATLDAVGSDSAAPEEAAVERDEREGGDRPAEPLEALAGAPDGEAAAGDLEILVGGGEEV
jgi:hypothetical protein